MSKGWIKGGREPELPFSDRETSRDAALAQAGKPKKVENDRRRILAFLLTRGPRGATDAEIQAFLVMGGNTERPRRGELAKRDLIRKNGQRRHGSAVWVAHVS